MKTLFFNIPLLYLLIFFTSCGDKKADKKADSVSVAREENKSNLPDSLFNNEAKFSVACAENHLLQIKIAALCETKATLDTVVKFGRTMVKNQVTLHQQLESWARTNSISIPESLSPDKQEKVDDLFRQTEKNFEKKFTRLVIEHQQQLLQQYRQEAQNGTDTLFKAWAREKISVMEADLGTARWIEAVLSKAPLNAKS